MVSVLHAETAVNIPCSIDTEIEILKSVRGDTIAKFRGKTQWLLHDEALVSIQTSKQANNMLWGAFCFLVTGSCDLGKGRLWAENSTWHSWA